MGGLLRIAPLPAETRLKLGASVLLAAPAALLLVLGVAEMVGGDLTGSQHLVQAAPLLALLGVGWRYPRAAGFVLCGLGALFFVSWLVLIVISREPGGEIIAWIGAGFFLFVPPVVAGWLMLKASHPRQ